MAIVSRIAGSLLLSLSLSLPAGASVVVPGQGTWESTLLGRDLNGYAVAADSSEAVFLYDTALDLTWLRDTAAYGPMRWTAAMAFAADLSINGFGGWRLPTLIEPGGCDGRLLDGCWLGSDVVQTGAAFSELMYLWNVELGNAPRIDYATVNTGPFLNLGLPGYPHDSRWIGVGATRTPEPEFQIAWTLYMRNGLHLVDPHLQDQWDFMLVRAGDVQPLPGPGSLALVLLGLTLALGAKRFSR